MNSLIVFDNTIRIANLDRIRKLDGIVYLFPLTSSQAVIYTVQERLKSFGFSTEMLHAAELINKAADRVRDKYINFIAELPEKVTRRGKNIKQIFAIDDHATLWWYSLIAEKNTFKTDSFNRLAQLDAIIDIIKNNNINVIVSGAESKKLRNSMLEYSSANRMHFIDLRSNYATKLGGFFLYAEHNIRLIAFVWSYFLRIVKVKKMLAETYRSPLPERYLTIVSYYPNIDISAGEKGIFKNHYYPYLQETLEGKGEKIIWVLMYVHNYSISFDNALILAKKMIKNGHILFFLEEFISIRDQVGALLTIMKHGIKFLFLEKRISKVHRFDNYSFYHLFRDDWYLSFAGFAGYQNLLFYNSFKSMIKRLKTGTCLYQFELQSWEKALINAREAQAVNEPLFAYQCGTVSRMLLNYFNHPLETKTRDGEYPIPHPDKFICNGNIPMAYMKESGWPDSLLCQAEAIRYNHLKKYLKRKYYNKKNIIFVPLSISSEDSCGIVNMVCAAFGDIKGRNFEVWIKAHPFLKIDGVLKRAGMDLAHIPFIVKHDPIAELLPEVKLVIAGESGVAVKALAFGCRVIILDFPEFINMSPLRYVRSSVINKASSAIELRRMADNMISERCDYQELATEAQKVFNDFLYLDAASDMPGRFLACMSNNN